MSCLHALVALAAALNNADADGRIIVDASARTLRFVLLNAAAHFAKARLLSGAYFSQCPCIPCLVPHLEPKQSRAAVHTAFPGMLFHVNPVSMWSACLL
jgi:hypothetical protein